MPYINEAIVCLETVSVHAFLYLLLVLIYQLIRALEARRTWIRQPNLALVTPWVRCTAN